MKEDNYLLNANFKQVLGKMMTHTFVQMSLSILAGSITYKFITI
jgi:hypothetical protein